MPSPFPGMDPFLEGPEWEEHQYDRDAALHLSEAEQAWLKERLTANAT